MAIPQLFTNKITLFLALTAFALIAPQAQVFAELEQAYAQIASLQESIVLHKAKLRDTKTAKAIAPEIEWDRIASLASLYPQLEVVPMTAPAQEVRSKPLWWGKVQGDLLQVLLFARKVDDDPHTQLHSFSHNDGRASLFFYILTKA